MRAAFLALVATTCALAAISPDSVAAGNTEQRGGVWGALFKTPGEVAPTRCSCILSVITLSRLGASLGHTRSDNQNLTFMLEHPAVGGELWTQRYTAQAITDDRKQR